MKKFISLLLALTIVFSFGFSSSAEENVVELEQVEHARAYNEIARIQVEEEQALKIRNLIDSDLSNLDKNYTEISKEIVVYSGTFAAKKEDTIESVVSKESKNRKEKFSITIGVEQPNPGTYDCVALEYSDSKGKHVSGYSIGHTFIVLGDHSKKESIYSARGFYPATGLSGQEVINNTSVTGAIKDDLGHTFTARKTYWVDKSTYYDAIKVINSKTEDINGKTLKYSIVDYNCTTFVEDVVSDLGLSTGMASHTWVIPKEIKDRFWYYKDIISKLEKNSGYYPGAAGEQIKN